MKADAEYKNAMINEEFISLEMRSRTMHALIDVRLISAAGPSGNRSGVWEAMVSQLRWEMIKSFLDSQSLPYKIGFSPDAERVAFNGADW